MILKLPKTEWEKSKMTSHSKKGKIGQSFDDYLKEEGRYEEITIRALLSLMMETLDDIENIFNDSVKFESKQDCGINKVLFDEVKQLDQKYQNFRKNISETIFLNESELHA